MRNTFSCPPTRWTLLPRLLILSPCLWLMLGNPSAVRAEEYRISSAQCLHVLQQARQAGLPSKITDSSAANQAMWEWDRADGPDKKRVIEELINWIPVFLEQPKTLRAYKFLELHPAVYVLWSMGVEVIKPLEHRLLSDPEPVHAKLIALLLQHLAYAHFQDVKNTYLLGLKAKTNSVRLKAELDEVDDETRLHSNEEGEAIIPLDITQGPNSK